MTIYLNSTKKWNFVVFLFKCWDILLWVLCPRNVKYFSLCPCWTRILITVSISIIFPVFRIALFYVTITSELRNMTFRNMNKQQLEAVSRLMWIWHSIVLFFFWEREVWDVNIYVWSLVCVFDWLFNAS